MEDNEQNRGVPYVPQERRTQRHIYDHLEPEGMVLLAFVGLVVLAALAAVIISVVRLP